MIEPILRNPDFTHVLELAPGHGRNTEFLRRKARSIHLVDVNSTCIEVAGDVSVRSATVACSTTM